MDIIEEDKPCFDTLSNRQNIYE